ncbi:hypothetical protein [Streptomyces sp. NPDC014006]|uniref:hypothetical protein n=1 Tax=Streptomyces sp. NPDC014006 TaxID=3364870 RepID=UPI0036F50680
MIHSRLGDLIATGLTDRLDRRDRMLLERRAGIKSAGDKPFPLDPRGWWYAVPGETYDGAFEALGLHDRFPVTMDEGADVEDLPFREDAVPAFITPELDGWRLVFGNLPDLIGLDWDAWMAAAERLSALCGEAQMFYEDGAGGTCLWVVAREGRIRRRCAAQNDADCVGDPFPWEEHDGTTTVARACGRLSVDPGLVGASTRMRGHGWLALSRPGIGHENLNALVRL